LVARERSVWPSNVRAYEKDRAATLRMLGKDRFESLRTAGANVPAGSAVDAAIDVLKTVFARSDARSIALGRGSNLRGAELTAREREVVRLVLRGMTNRQIASELMMAPKTAVNHVAHALDKLGVTSRVQLVARAGDLGLDALRG
jgi:DNA-binding NarL/FixJ family response regulator